jgi:hypothetical protein
MGIITKRKTRIKHPSKPPRLLLAHAHERTVAIPVTASAGVTAGALAMRREVRGRQRHVAVPPPFCCCELVKLERVRRAVDVVRMGYRCALGLRSSMLGVLRGGVPGYMTNKLN